MISRETFANLNTPTARKLLFQIIGVLFAIVLFWLIVAAILSLFPAWMIVLATFVLGGVWLVKNAHLKRREAWIDSGLCGQCGYDLRASPDVCPECGRDARLDEPTWKKVRRNFAAKLAAEANGAGAIATVPAARPTAQMSQPSKLKNVVIHRPAVDDEPIPLEPSSIESESEFRDSTAS